MNSTPKNYSNLPLQKNLNSIASFKGIKWLPLLCLMVCCFWLSNSTCFGQPQQKKVINVYTLHRDWHHQHKVVIPSGLHKEVLKAGWTLTEVKGGVTIQRTLEKDTLIVTKKDSSIAVLTNWKIQNIKHTNDAPDKVYLNPIPFTETADAALNQIVYIPLPANEKVIFSHVHTKWSAITIPFTIRPAVDNRLNSQVTSEFKIGTAFSLNQDWEVFKNRRMDAKKNTYGFSAGLGFGLGRITLNDGSTSLSGATYENEEEGLVFFVTPGLGLNIRGFKILGFYGWDFGLTKNINDWNYHRKPYIGIGLGFDFWTLRR